MIASPCTKVCAMDADQRYCLGCGRTLGEIARWGEMTDAERGSVIASLDARQVALSNSPQGNPAAPERAS